MDSRHQHSDVTFYPRTCLGGVVSYHYYHPDDHHQRHSDYRPFKLTTDWHERD